MNQNTVKKDTAVIIGFIAALFVIVYFIQTC